MGARVNPSTTIRLSADVIDHFKMGAVGGRHGSTKPFASGSGSTTRLERRGGSGRRSTVEPYMARECRGYLQQLFAGMLIQGHPLGYGVINFNGDLKP